MRCDFVPREFLGKELSRCAFEIIVLSGSNRLGNICLTTAVVTKVTLHSLSGLASGVNGVSSFVDQAQSALNPGHDSSRAFDQCSEFFE